MRITFPHMGSISLVLDSLFTNLGLQIIPPPPITRRTIELGTKHSPEFACLPFKVNLGNYIEAIEAGADTILMAGGIGPCRFGYYAQVQYDILRDLGYSVGLITLEPGNVLQEIKQKLGSIKAKNSWLNIWREVRLAANKMDVLDDLEKKVFQLMPRERDTNACLRVLDVQRDSIVAAQSRTQLKTREREAIMALHRVPLKVNTDTIRVGLIGEIYMLLEPYVNLDIERRLASMGVEVHKSIYFSSWLKEHLFHEPVARKHHKQIVKAAKPYLDHFVGGHGLESIGNTVLYKQQGFDGVIQLLPLTCMPEIVAQSILPKVSKDHRIPVMSLVLDEHSGEAGLQTRLEAFVDMLRFKRGREERMVVS